MEKIKAHIISHAHWDREWYMPYEKHHIRLISLIDDVIELFRKDKEFKSFHLDGQMTYQMINFVSHIWHKE